MRLQKFLADCGVASRRESERIIAQGRCTINGGVAKVGDTVNPGQDEIRLDGRPIESSERVYILLDKPQGVVTSVGDTHGRRTVMDCVKGFPQRIFPVGRLDLDVTGALILTNDGEFSNRLMHPRYRVNKVYEVWVKGEMKPVTARKLANGVMLDDGRTAPAIAKIRETKKGATRLELTIHEGRKRIVKRMCEKVGHRVIELRRLSIGSVDVKGMSPGDWRFLENREVAALRRLAKMTK